MSAEWAIRCSITKKTAWAKPDAIVQAQGRDRLTSAPNASELVEAFVAFRRQHPGSRQL